ETEAGKKLVETALEDTRQARQNEAQEKEKAQVNAHFLGNELSYREWGRGNVRRAEQLLDQGRPDLRGWEWHYLKRLCRPELLALPASGHATAFSPDGRPLALPPTP